MSDDPLDAMKARWNHIQASLFPWLREEVDPLTEALGQLVTTLDVIGLEAFVPEPPRGAGRPPEDRRALARAFVAKAVLGIPTTKALIERLAVDKPLRHILGWERRSQVPSEATFSRAFAEFAQGDLPDKMHAALIERSLGGRIVGVIARDATEIEAREKPAVKEANDKKDDPPPPDGAQPPRKRGRPRKDEATAEARADAPGAANLAERQPNARRTAHSLRCRLQEEQQRLQRDLDRIQAAYRRRLRPDPRLLRADLGLRSRQSGRHSLDDHDRRAGLLSLRSDGRRLRRRRHSRQERGARPSTDHRSQLSRRHETKAEWAKEVERMKFINIPDPDDVIYDFRTMVERVNARLKDEFGARFLRVRGAIKVKCHLMFGIVALTADQILRVASSRPAPA